jgi:sulfur carrier protein
MPYPRGDAVFYFEMTLKVNGEALSTAAETVQALIEELDVAAGGVAVEVNLAVVRKRDYATFRLKDGDTVEIVNFVGGG